MKVIGARKFGEIAAVKSQGTTVLRPGDKDKDGLLCHEAKTGTLSLMDYVLGNDKVVNCAVRNKFADDAVTKFAKEIHVVQSQFELTVRAKSGVMLKMTILAYGELTSARSKFKIMLLSNYKQGDEQKAIASALRMSGLAGRQLQDLSQQAVLNFLKFL